MKDNPFSPEEEVIIRRAAQSVWSEIASDVLAMERKGRVSQGVLIELVMDADRLTGNLRRRKFGRSEPEPARVAVAERLRQDPSLYAAVERILKSEFPAKFYC